MENTEPTRSTLFKSKAAVNVRALLKAEVDLHIAQGQHEREHTAYSAAIVARIQKRINSLLARTDDDAIHAERLRRAELYNGSLHVAEAKAKVHEARRAYAAAKAAGTLPPLTPQADIPDVGGYDNLGNIL